MSHWDFSYIKISKILVYVAEGKVGLGKAAAEDTVDLGGTEVEFLSDKSKRMNRSK